MEDCTSATVFSFRTFGVNAELQEIALFKATRRAIEEMDGEIIEGTDEQVPLTELDHDGHYRRQATGWGGLA